MADKLTRDELIKLMARQAHTNPDLLLSSTVTVRGLITILEWAGVIADTAPVEVVRHEEVLDAILHCPWCGLRHIDEGEWATRPHHTHECQGCGQEWRVEPYARGVTDEYIMNPGRKSGG